MSNCIRLVGPMHRLKTSLLCPDGRVATAKDDLLSPSLSKSSDKACIRYSKRRKFRPKMRQNALGGRALPGPAGEAYPIN